MKLVGKNQNRFVFGQSKGFAVHRDLHFTRTDDDELKALVQMGGEAQVFPFFQFYIVGRAEVVEFV